MAAADEINEIRAAGAALAEGDERAARALVARIRTERGDAEAEFTRACIKSHARVLRSEGAMFVRSEPGAYPDRRQAA